MQEETAFWNRGIFANMELRTPQGRVIYFIILVVLVGLALTVAIPFVFSFTSGLKGSQEIYKSGYLFPEEATWENFARAWDRFDLLKLFANTVAIVVGGMLMQLGVSTLAAYSLSRLNPIGARYIMWGFLTTLMIPSIAYIVPLYVTVARLNLLGTYFGLWLPYGVNAFMIFILKNFFDNLPSELFDAAKVDGASAFQVFWLIAMPLTRPILLVLAVLTFVGLWKDFLWPYLVLLTEPELQPITVHLYFIESTSSSPLNIQMAGYFMAMVPPLVIAIVLQRYMERGLSIGAVKG